MPSVTSEVCAAVCPKTPVATRSPRTPAPRKMAPRRMSRIRLIRSMRLVIAAHRPRGGKADRPVGRCSVLCALVPELAPVHVRPWAAAGLGVAAPARAWAKAAVRTAALQGLPDAIRPAMTAPGLTTTRHAVQGSLLSEQLPAVEPLQRHRPAPRPRLVQGSPVLHTF